MNIKIEETASGRYRALGDDIRFHVVGNTISDALRRAADFLEEVDRILCDTSDKE